jgi:hypothetical protein
MTATNKRLLISKSRGDSNQCTPCRGKPDQHTTYASHASPRTLGVCFLWAVPIRGNLSRVIDRVEQSHCSWEEGLPTQSTARCWPIHGSVPSFSPEPANEAVGAKPSIYRWPATRLIGPITPVCDRYVQYLLVGANRTVLNRHRWGYNLRDAGFPRTTPQPFRPAVSPFHLRAPPGLQFNQVLTTKPKCWVWKNLWLSHGPSTTRPSTVAYVYA